MMAESSHVCLANCKQSISGAFYSGSSPWHPRQGLTSGCDYLDDLSPIIRPQSPGPDTQVTPCM